MRSFSEVLEVRIITCKLNTFMFFYFLFWNCFIVRKDANSIVKLLYTIYGDSSSFNIFPHLRCSLVLCFLLPSLHVHNFFLWTMRGWSCIYFTLTILVSIFYKQWYSHMLTLRLLNSGNLTWSDTLIYYTSVCYLDYLKSLSLDFFSPPCSRGFSLGSHIVFVVMSFLTSNSYLAVLCLPWQ